jgi:hypothetical protein
MANGIDVSKRQLKLRSVPLALALLVVAPFQVAAEPLPAGALMFPAFRLGETISFSSKTTAHQPRDSEMTKVFDVKVLRVTSTGAVVRWTLRSGTGSENVPASEKLWMATFKDVPIDLRLDSSGLPLEVVNWAETRSRMMAAVPGGKGWSAEGITPEKDSMLMFVIMHVLAGDLSTMAAVQGHDPIHPGRRNLMGVDLPVNRRPSLTPDRRSILTRLAPASAVARRRSVEPLAERNA